MMELARPVSAILSLFDEESLAIAHGLALAPALLLAAAVCGVLAAAAAWRRDEDGEGPPTPPSGNDHHAEARCSARGASCARKLEEELEPPCAERARRRPAEVKYSVAEEYWANGFGRLKYCGLRPRGCTRKEPPLPLPLELAMKLPLPKHTEAEKEKLALLAERFAEESRLGKRVDTNTLLRFLRARKGSVEAAERYLREHLNFRKEWDIDRMFTHWNLEAFEQRLAPWWLSGGYMGWSRANEAVAYERIGAANWRKLCTLLPWETIVKLDLVHGQRCLAAMEEEALRRGEPPSRVVLIEDLQGFGWDQCVYTAARNMGRLTAIRDRMMPSLISKVLVINAPKAFTSAWAMFKNVLEADTQEKVQVASSREASLQLLRKHIDDENIPAFLGGSMKLGGDPECRQHLAPGGLPPPEAIARVTELMDPHFAKISGFGGACREPAPEPHQEDQDDRSGCGGGYCFRRPLGFRAPGVDRDRGADRTTVVELLLGVCGLKVPHAI